MKSSKIFIFSLALFGTLLIGGPALSPSLSHGDAIAQAADTTTTVTAEMNISAIGVDQQGKPFDNPRTLMFPSYNASVVTPKATVTLTNNKTTVKAIMDAIIAQSRGHDDYAQQMVIQLVADVANGVITAEQAVQASQSLYGQDFPDYWFTFVATGLADDGSGKLVHTSNPFAESNGNLVHAVLDQKALNALYDETVIYDGKSKTLVAPDLKIPFKQADLPMQINFKTSDGAAVLPDKYFKDTTEDTTSSTETRNIYGFAGQVLTDPQHLLIPVVPGYTADRSEVTFKKDASGTQQETITYNKNSSPVTTSDSSSATPTPTTATQSFQVYGKQKLYRYQHADFKKSERIQKYATKPSAYAPVFTVVNTTQSKAGNPRYQLSDGTYITAKSAYVGKSFLEDETAKTLYVTNPKGIWTHTTTAFKDQLTHIKQGAAVKVTKLVKAGNTTRYQLANGTFVTGNQRYVTTVKPQRVARVKAKGNRNLYSDVNLTHRLKHYRKGHIFTVKGWDYSRGQNQLISGTKRYKVAGGYITGNPKLVEIIK